ncbi:hypothetical protein QUB19_28040, partial [Microcoleus sp. B4-C5]|uniref:hypothetical protein n=2 Tax=Microcoleus TaxID=44471 RepID=UPI002FD0EBD7
RPARPFWTGGTPIPQTCGSYLIFIPEKGYTRFTNTIRIIKTPLEKGGLTAENQLDSPYIEEPKPA